jgi:hypothetical protein
LTGGTTALECGASQPRIDPALVIGAGFFLKQAMAPRRYKVYTDPNLYRTRSPWLVWGIRCAIVLAALLILGALGRPLFSMLAVHGATAH